MREVSLFEAKTHLSGLVNEIVESQDEIAITKHGHPTVIMRPFNEPAQLRVTNAIAKIKRLRETLPPLSVDEIIDLRDEGRRVYP